MNNSLNAVITGGASGLGAATAENLIESGGTVTIIDIQEKLGKETASRLGENCNYIKLDITQEKEVQENYSRISQEFGPILLSVNCAGIGTPAKVLTKDSTHSLESVSYTHLTLPTILLV